MLWYMGLENDCYSPWWSCLSPLVTGQEQHWLVVKCVLMRPSVYIHANIGNSSHLYQGMLQSLVVCCVICAFKWIFLVIYVELEGPPLPATLKTRKKNKKQQVISFIDWIYKSAGWINMIWNPQNKYFLISFI